LPYVLREAEFTGGANELSAIFTFYIAALQNQDGAKPSTAANTVSEERSRYPKLAEVLTHTKIFH